MLDFDSVQAALESLGASAGAADSHGTLCALLIDNADLATWLGHTLEQLPEKGSLLASEQIALLEQLFDQTRKQLNNEDFDLELFLPDDTDDFDLRLLGLSTWCQVFLYGFGVGGIGAEDSLDDDSRECLSDLLEISKLSHDAETSDEVDRQYAELVEHVRIATLTLNQSSNPRKPASTVHSIEKGFDPLFYILKSYPRKRLSFAATEESL